jgi:hypothetical protein
MDSGHTVFIECFVLAYRDVSPSNMVVIKNAAGGWQLYLLDLHVATRLSEPGYAVVCRQNITGKAMYISMRLTKQDEDDPEPEHTLATDLESLFFRFVAEVFSG